MDRSTRRSVARRLRLVAAREALEILANGPCIAVPIGRVSGEQFRDDRLQRQWALDTQRLRRPQRSNPLLEPARIQRSKWLNAADHLVQQDADRPEIGIPIDVAPPEP